MLGIWIEDDYNKPPFDYESDIKGCFDYSYEKSWFSDPFVQNIIKIIDNTEVIPYKDSYVLDSPVLGIIPPTDLSTGCKSLILLLKTSIPVDGDRMGDNCYEILKTIGENKDIEISLGHLPHTTKNFYAVIRNYEVVGETSRSVETRAQLLNEYCYWRHKYEIEGKYIPMYKLLEQIKEEEGEYE